MENIHTVAKYQFQLICLRFTDKWVRKILTAPMLYGPSRLCHQCHGTGSFFAPPVGFYNDILAMNFCNNIHPIPNSI